MKRQWVAGVCVGTALVLTGWSGAQAGAAEANGWTFEVVPYTWLMNVDGNVMVGNQKARVEQDFADMISSVDLAGELYLSASKGPFGLWAQGDYFSMNEDASTSLGRASLDSDASLLAGGVSYRVPSKLERLDMDVFAGARYMSLDNTLRISGVAEANSSSDATDALVGIRLVFRCTDTCRLNLPVSVGAGGDSDLVCDIQPDVQCQFTEMISGHLGARWLYYDYSAGSTEFEGTFNGLMLGLGFTL